ncbi:dual specificity mitogen-activated protein kinase kinase 7-like isoform X1 [Amphibalanus amphitrite]|uniref:dual specificity mitogen-activated protein kinase kinase 7-like isoform X1 n=1 Tax=Amphibalanus amphitrite TaxID=1232801 RepID=UPI001C91C306|nr:dual specificity mitogen-activated protein kinase kinase 7-like isoform X1 [Amphibalanus amphitrite]
MNASATGATPRTRPSASAMSGLRLNVRDVHNRLQEENESRDADRGLNLDFSRPKEGQPSRRPRPLPITAEFAPGRSDEQRRPPRNLHFPSHQQPFRRINSAEIQTKMNEIMQLTGILTIDGVRYRASPEDLQHVGELGTGSCGHVVKMVHKPSGKVLAVKQMRRSGNPEENKRIIMDLDVVLKSHDCPYIVQCLGCFITDADVWICMELMATCLDKLLKKLGNKPIPEPILGKITVSTVKALHYLKDQHGVIHRDVKPSNILLDEMGQVKMCDFGISGRLVDSKAKTRTAGSAAYMAPERIEPPNPDRPDYDIRADVWSLGITLVELATGVLPYADCTSEFEALTRVLKYDAPLLPDGGGFSPELRSFVKDCLTKDYKQRPKYKRLLDHEFIKKSERMRVDVSSWFRDVQAQTSGIKTPTTRRRTPPPASPHHPFHSRRRNPEPERFTPESWAPRGRFSERSGLYNFLGLNPCADGQPRYNSMASPLMMRRQDAGRGGGSQSVPNASTSQSHGSPSGRPPLDRRAFFTPEPHRRPFPHHSHQPMFSQP